MKGQKKNIKLCIRCQTNSDSRKKRFWIKQHLVFVCLDCVNTVFFGRQNTQKWLEEKHRPTEPVSPLRKEINVEVLQ